MVHGLLAAPPPAHLGALHPVEQALTLVLAFGPFAVLGVVIWLRRRHDAAQDETQDETRDETRDAGERERAETGQRDR